MEFYSVKQRATVKVADKDCVKAKKARSNGGYTYMVKAKDKTGAGLVKIVGESQWKALKCKEA